jgi:hypothetical protein
MPLYEVMGYRTLEGSGVNTDPNSGRAIKPALEPIYRTDDFDEVNQICLAGGYTDSSNVWWVAEGWREVVEPNQTVTSKSEIAAPTDIPSARHAISQRPVAEPNLMVSDTTLPRKADVLTDNSSATIDNTGTVRTDAQKQPLTEEDVAAIAVEHANIPRKRTILP